MKKLAVISAILDAPKEVQTIFNNIIVDYKHMVKGRMGIPLDQEEITVICITVVGEINEINSLTGKLGRIKNIQVKTSISKKDITES